MAIIAKLRCLSSTVYSNIRIMHSTYVANLRSSFERLIPSGGPSLFQSTADAAANEWRCGILARKFEVGVQSAEITV